MCVPRGMAALERLPFHISLDTPPVPHDSMVSSKPTSNQRGERMKTSNYDGKWMLKAGAIVTIAGAIGLLTLIIVAYILLPQHPHKEISESYYNQLHTWWSEHPQVRDDIMEAAKSDLMITYSEYETIKQKVRKLRLSISKGALYKYMGVLDTLNE